MFHLIKDQIGICKDYSMLEITCYSCNQKGHFSKDCHKIHFIVDRKDTIANYALNQSTFRASYQRNDRAKFSALGSLPLLSEIAEMIQEDYSDYTISDEDLSQDSLDVILE